MRIVMQEGFEVTPQIEEIARRYDLYVAYIDNYGQRQEAEAKNSKIMQELRELGVKFITA